MYFTLDQNNSGGYYIQNNDVASVVIVEADNALQATIKLDQITSPYSEYCPCCGERWYIDIIEDEDGTSVPMIFDSLVENRDKLIHPDVIIYHKDGTIERIQD